MEKILNFGKKTKKEAISFLEEIEKKFETSLHYYKEEIRDSNDNDKFELVYYANDKELWALENVSENEVIFDHKILDCCLKEDESEIIKEASYKELYEINLDDIFVKDDKAFYVCSYGDYYGCEVYEYKNNKIGKFLDFTNLEEHMFEDMEKINLSLREKLTNIQGLGHEQVLCFKDKKDIGTRKFKQEIFYDVLDFLNDEELENLYINKEAEPINGPYGYIGRLTNVEE